jgi:hypothetical protein
MRRGSQPQQHFLHSFTATFWCALFAMLYIIIVALLSNVAAAVGGGVLLVDASTVLATAAATTTTTSAQVEIDAATGEIVSEVVNDTVDETTGDDNEYSMATMTTTATSDDDDDATSSSTNSSATENEGKKNDTHNEPHSPTIAASTTTTTTTTTAESSTSISELQQSLQQELDCGIWLAPSALQGAGLGMYAGRNFTKGERLQTRGDLAIAIVDIVAHNFDDAHFEFLWDEYTWNAADLYQEKEGLWDVNGASPGFGSAANSFLPLKNVAESYCDVDSAGLHRANDPGAGAFTYYHNRKSVASQDIVAFEEL